MTERNKILVVEDNDFVRMQIVTYLKEIDCAVTEASDGNAALDHMAQDVFDLAIVDVRMEPMDGFEFIKAIRDDGMKTPVVLVTGDQTSDLLKMAGKWSVGAVLLKPVQKERLQKTVLRTLESNKRLA
jgi:CheY-like chemotaxis protein